MSLLKKNVTLERDLVRERDPGGRQMKPPMMPTEQETNEREREEEREREHVLVLVNSVVNHHNHSLAWRWSWELIRFDKK